MLKLSRAILTTILLSLPAAAWAAPTIDLVRVVKSERKLYLLSQGQIVRTYSIALGGNPSGPKQQEGDKKTPEGRFILDEKKPDSAFHKAFHISYPRPSDVVAAKLHGVSPGGQVMVHGQKNGFGWLGPLTQHFDWTNGCIALKNNEIDEMWTLVEAGTAIDIQP